MDFVSSELLYIYIYRDGTIQFSKRRLPSDIIVSFTFPDANVAAYNEVYKKFDCAGALIWSLRGHSDKSGFDTHEEGNNIFSYHAPGWQIQTSKAFDTQESSVISATYNAR
jgi:hypothetical protein